MAEHRSAVELAELGRFREAAAAIDRAGILSNDIRVLRAQLEAHIGTPKRARELARGLLKERLTAKEKSLCWALIGRVCLSLGQRQDGLRAMAQSFTEAAGTHDPVLNARLRANYVHWLHAWVGWESAALEIPKLRQSAIRAGDPYSLIAMHIVVASIDAQKSLTKSALASTDIARELLLKFDQLWLKGRLAITSFYISVIQADYTSALRWNMEALQCARLSGSREIKVPALANLALLKLKQSEFHSALAALSELRHEVEDGESSITLVGLRDIAMQIAIASDDLEEAKSIDTHINEVLSTVEVKDGYYELWHLLNRVRYLYRTGQTRQGVAVGVEALARMERLRDPFLMQRMSVLVAEGYGRISDPKRGAALLSTATAQYQNNSLELTAEICRVTGRLVASEDREAAIGHFARAWRIFSAIGNITSRSEVERDCRELIPDSVIDLSGEITLRKRVLDGPAQPSVSSAISPSKPAGVDIHRFAVLMESGSLAPLLANEIYSLLIDTGAIHSAEIVSIDAAKKRRIIKAYSRSNSAKGDGSIVIGVGSHADLQYELSAVPLDTASTRATAMAVERVAHSVIGLAHARQTEREQSALWQESSPEHQLGLICASDKMLELVKTIKRVATSHVTVLLTGETGVGKELFARALHQASPRNDSTFIPFNCTAVARDMFDSQLFGHKKGAFTGAIEDAPGVIRAAAGGTLFLDEIGEMSLDVQPKLLRFLESGEIQPLGDPKPKQVDVRIVAATNAKLDQLVSEGRFREDLFYRLNVIRIDIPPLRERREEIPALVQHFLEKFGRELQKPMLRLADETLEYLVLYRWPGNVRQLANEIRRMVAMAEPGSVLMPAHLSDEIASSRKTVPATAPQPREAHEILTRIDQPLSAAVDHVERAAIQRAMKLSDGRLEDAAKLLGLSRKGLYLKRQRLNLE